nr:calmodulin-like protein 9 [Ipomoea batatas]
MIDPATILVIVSVIASLAKAANSVANTVKTIVETLEKTRGNGWKPNAESKKVLANISSMMGKSFSKLDGSNYKSWSVTMKKLLIKNHLWDLVKKGYEEKGHNDKEDREKDSLISFIFLLAVDESVRGCVVGANNSKAAWDAIKTQYKEENLSLIWSLEVRRSQVAASVSFALSQVEHRGLRMRDQIPDSQKPEKQIPEGCRADAVVVVEGSGGCTAEVEAESEESGEPESSRIRSAKRVGENRDEEE